jgi:uncharacterized glyoxalase superfamily protein PhnB
MSRLIAGAPILLVRNFSAALAYWRDTAGFGDVRIWGEPPGFAILAREGVRLMLKAVPGGTDVVPHGRLQPGMWDAYFWVEDVDALHADFAARGAMIAYPPCDQFYGCRELALVDPDGHEVGFGQETGA